MRRFTSLDICAGAGGQALGLERAGFDPIMLIDDDEHACTTLRTNRPLHPRTLQRRSCAAEILLPASL